MITSVAVMQCVERGLVTLDQPLASILPEFKTPLIVTGLDEATGKPVVKSTTHAITLRQLLTHTSGMGYDFSSPLIEAWIKTQPLRLHKRDIRAEYVLPLSFVPRMSGKWQYSIGLDWAGQVVERLNGDVRLGEYMQENIFKPLGMRSSTFRPLQRKDIMERLVPCVKRAKDGSLSMHPGDVAIATVIDPVDDAGGSGLYSTAEDYHRLLESIVRDDGKVLKTAMIDELFRPQLQEHEELQKTLSECGIPRRTGSHVPGGPKEVKWNHALGGVVAVDGVSGVAAKGTMWWDGMANTLWMSIFRMSVEVLTVTKKSYFSSWIVRRTLVLFMAVRCCRLAMRRLECCSRSCRKICIALQLNETVTLNCVLE
jgi:CubicO group peptidase (beta-lactamase class C family)